MFVIKRDGKSEQVMFDKITTRIANMCKIDPKLSPEVDPTLVAQKVIQGLYSGVKTSELDDLAAETAAFMSTVHPDYDMLAARITASNLQKETPSNFIEFIERAYNYINPENNLWCPMITKDIYDYAKKFAVEINNKIDANRDFSFDYFGLKTLMKSYLLKENDKILESPQFMWMRVSMGIHLVSQDAIHLTDIFETYDLMSKKYFTHATPTLYNSGTPNHQMSSCFLMQIKEDSIEGIYDTLKQTALISKRSGGIGISISNVRANNSYIAGTNGRGGGIIPMLKVFNYTSSYVNQSGRRKGSFGIYIEPFHPDIFEFLDLKKNTGAEELRCRDLFLGLWIPDIFMRRVKEQGKWSLFCPHECPGLVENYGEKFDQLYLEYEKQGKARKTVPATELWNKILDTQIETGLPYICYKDAANIKSNQKNLGTIRCSNLCTEIMQYSSPNEIAVCNLNSLSLPEFVKNGEFDHDLFFETVQVVVKNLNKIIDKNLYPVEEARNSNLKHRPIGIGVQGLANIFMMLGYAFDSPEAKKLNYDIFETLYYAALWKSVDLAQEYGKYSSFEGSPASQGLLQFDLWGVKLQNTRWNWDDLKLRISKYGLRNSLLLAPMPTASTSQILGNTEGIEPLTSNIYSRRVMAGEFTVVNRYLYNDLVQLGVWNKQTKDKIIADRGSVKNLDIPVGVKNKYKTVWEISQKVLIDLAADRGIFIDQSQSLNLYKEAPSRAVLTGMHFYSWEKGLKTGMYYLRTRPAVNAIQFTVEPVKQEPVKQEPVKQETEQEPVKQEAEVCTMSEGCITCSS